MMGAEFSLCDRAVTVTPFHKDWTNVRITHQDYPQRFNAVIGVHSQGLQRNVETSGEVLFRVFVHQIPGELTNVILSPK